MSENLDLEVTTNNVLSEESTSMLSEITTTEIEATTPDKSAMNFRRRVPNNILVSIKETSPKLAKQMVENPSVAITFARDVTDKQERAAEMMLKGNKKVSIPEADAIMKDIHRTLDGYEKQYSGNKKSLEKSTVGKFFDRVRGKGKSAAYNAKYDMVKQASSLNSLLDSAKVKLVKLGRDINEDLVQAKLLQETSEEARGDIAAVIAYFEEILEVVNKEILAMRDAQEAAVANGEMIVEYHGRKFSTEEFSSLISSALISEGEIEKTWMGWRQKFFLQVVNEVSARELWAASLGLKSAVERISTMAIPAAKSQLAAWQTAANLEYSAENVQNVQDSVEALIVKSTERVKDSVLSAATANQRPLFSEKSLVEMTDNISQMLAGVVDIEIKGREDRARAAIQLQAGENSIAKASAEQQARFIKAAVALLNGQSDGDVKALSSEELKLISDRKEEMVATAVTEEITLEKALY